MCEHDKMPRVSLGLPDRLRGLSFEDHAESILRAVVENNATRPSGPAVDA